MCQAWNPEILRKGFGKRENQLWCSWVLSIIVSLSLSLLLVQLGLVSSLEHKVQDYPAPGMHEYSVPAKYQHSLCRLIRGEPNLVNGVPVQRSCIPRGTQFFISMAPIYFSFFQSKKIRISKLQIHFLILVDQRTDRNFYILSSLMKFPSIRFLLPAHRIFNYFPQTTFEPDTVI